jgi:hypothetical protein
MLLKDLLQLEVTELNKNELPYYNDFIVENTNEILKLSNLVRAEYNWKFCVNSYTKNLESYMLDAKSNNLIISSTRLIADNFKYYGVHLDKEYIYAISEGFVILRELPNYDEDGNLIIEPSKFEIYNGDYVTDWNYEVNTEGIKPIVIHKDNYYEFTADFVIPLSISSFIFKINENWYLIDTINLQLVPLGTDNNHRNLWKLAKFQHNNLIDLNLSKLSIDGRIFIETNTQLIEL